MKLWQFVPIPQNIVQISQLKISWKVPPACVNLGLKSYTSPFLPLTFDLIGMLVLKELGFKVECYYASEVSEEAVTVAAVRLKGEIRQVGDVQKITPKEVSVQTS